MDVVQELIFQVIDKVI